MLLQVLQAAQCLNLFQLQAQALIEQVPLFNFTANFSRSIRSLFALDFNSRCCWCFFNRSTGVDSNGSTGSSCTGSATTSDAGVTSVCSSSFGASFYTTSQCKASQDQGTD